LEEKQHYKEYIQNVQRLAHALPSLLTTVVPAAMTGHRYRAIGNQ
jgi:hypothetical protein